MPLPAGRDRGASWSSLTKQQAGQCRENGVSRNATDDAFAAAHGWELTPDQTSQVLKFANFIQENGAESMN